MKSLPIQLSLLTLACGMVFSGSASAATAAKTFYLEPGMSCQLSIPTTSTGVRPRATGFRNESGVTSFVICGLPYYYSGAVPTSFRVTVASYDSAAHSVDCTGVTRFSTGGSPAFVTKNAATPASNAPVTLQWTQADLEMGNFNASVTCALPVGAAILSVQMVVNDEIGS